MNLENQIYLAELTEAMGMTCFLRQRLRGRGDIRDVWLDWGNRLMVFDKGTHYISMPLTLCFMNVAGRH